MVLKIRDMERGEAASRGLKFEADSSATRYMLFEDDSLATEEDILVAGDSLATGDMPLEGDDDDSWMRGLEVDEIFPANEAEEEKDNESASDEKNYLPPLLDG